MQFKEHYCKFLNWNLFLLWEINIWVVHPIADEGSLTWNVPLFLFSRMRPDLLNISICLFVFEIQAQRTLWKSKLEECTSICIVQDDMMHAMKCKKKKSSFTYLFMTDYVLSLVAFYHSWDSLITLDFFSLESSLCCLSVLCSQRSYWTIAILDYNRSVQHFFWLAVINCYTKKNTE